VKAKARVTDAIEYAVIGKAVSDMTLAGWRAWRERTAYTIRVDSGEAIYPLVQAWVLSSAAPAQQRSLSFRTTRPRDVEPSHRAPRRVPALQHDGARPLRFRHHGHMVVARAGTEAALDLGDLGGSKLVTDRWLTLTMRTVAARDAVLAHLAHLVETEAHRPPCLYVNTRWGDNWRPTGPLAPRPLPSVALADGMLNRLIGDARTFLDSEVDYATWGLPYHRGYLLAGPPGTGKTSTIAAVCGELGLDVYYLTLSDVQGNSALANALSGVPPRSCLVIEDIDCVKAATDRDIDTDRYVTTAGLLNALDGFITPHGLVTVMTTNRPDTLDPALVRPGRVDMRLDLGLLDADQVKALIGYFAPRLSGADMTARWVGGTPAELVAWLRGAM
jgi:chaperone BCS1